MARFNTPAKARPVAVGPIRTKSKKTTTHEGADGFLRDARSELLLLAVSNFVGTDSFYESAAVRDGRYQKLVRKMAVKDGDWTAQLLAWLRGPEANMRTASLVGAAEYVKARLDAGITGNNRHVISSVLQRADEPGEMLAYWASKYGWPGGRTPHESGKMPTAPVLPQPVKRGVADAAVRLFSERSLLKYDTASHGFRFGDVIDLTHPEPKADWQSDLFRHALDRRHNRGENIPDALNMLVKNRNVRNWTPEEIVKRANYTGDELTPLSEVLAQSGMTWEDVPSLVNGPWTKELWEAIIPSMGYMALLRNLRNFDQAGVSDKVAAQVIAKLADPEQVARSRQLPMRFLSAYKAAPSLRWAYPLEQALDHSLSNIPKLAGRTLILVDTSSSMDAGFSKDGTLMRWDAAALFGIALASRCADADVVSFSSTAIYWGDPVGARTKVFDRPRGESLLKSLDRWKSGGWFLGGGTATREAVQKHFANHDRVVILTDEQAGGTGNPGAAIPKQTPLYTWNLAGYRASHAESGPFRHTFGGLNDSGFRLIPLLESGRNGTWPWIS